MIKVIFCPVIIGGHALFMSVLTTGLHNVHGKQKRVCLLVVSVCFAPEGKNLKLLVLYKNTNHQQNAQREFYHQFNTPLHVSTLLGHLQEELFVIVTLRLHFIVE
jgi:hypothetical protein